MPPRSRRSPRHLPPPRPQRSTFARKPPNPSTPWHLACQPCTWLCSRPRRCDPDRSTRKWAGRALDNLEDECTSECSACGPTIIEGPIYEGIVTPGGPPIYLDSPPVAEPYLDTPARSRPFDDSLPLPETLPSEIPPLPSSAAPFGTSADRKEPSDSDDTLARRDVETVIDSKRDPTPPAASIAIAKPTRRPTGGLFS